MYYAGSFPFEEMIRETGNILAYYRPFNKCYSDQVDLSLHFFEIEINDYGCHFGLSNFHSDLFQECDYKLINDLSMLICISIDISWIFVNVDKFGYLSTLIGFWIFINVDTFPISFNVDTFPISINGDRFLDIYQC